MRAHHERTLTFLCLLVGDMPTCTSLRVATRFIESSTGTVVVAHVDPGGTPWGWAFPALCRMHIIPLTVQGSGLICLEDGSGRRAFDVVRASPAFDIAALRVSVSRTRDSIESAWVRWCAARGWLDYSPREGSIHMYVGTSQEFVRHLTEEAFAPEFLQVDTETNTACLKVRLNRVIWRGADDGRDAAPG